MKKPPRIYKKTMDVLDVPHKEPQKSIEETIVSPVTLHDQLREAVEVLGVGKMRVLLDELYKPFAMPNAWEGVFKFDKKKGWAMDTILRIAFLEVEELLKEYEIKK